MEKITSKNYETYYNCYELFYKYINNIFNLNQLIYGLNEINDLHKIEINDEDSDKQIWFRFFWGDSVADTIDNIYTDLSLPKDHSNHKFLLNKINDAIENDSLEIYYS